MKRKWVLFLLTVFVWACFVATPASVRIGKETVVLKESKAHVWIYNTLGDRQGYPRDGITGLSYYWAPSSTLLSEIEMNNVFGTCVGELFSDYTIDALKKMPPQEAYDLAQAAFDRSQERNGVSKKKKLIYPLHYTCP